MNSEISWTDTEPSWTRVLGKKPEKTRGVVARWRQTSLTTLSQRYSSLRLRLVEHHLNRLIDQGHTGRLVPTEQCDFTSERQDPFVGAPSPPLEEFSEFLVGGTFSQLSS